MMMFCNGLLIGDTAVGLVVRTVVFLADARSADVGTGNSN